MRHHTPTGLFLTLATTLAAPLGAAEAASSTDQPIVIEAVDIGTHARRGFFAANDGTMDAAAGSWSGTSRQRARQVSVVAKNAIEWSDASIRGELSVRPPARPGEHDEHDEHDEQGSRTIAS